MFNNYFAIDKKDKTILVEVYKIVSKFWAGRLSNHWGYVEQDNFKMCRICM